MGRHDAVPHATRINKPRWTRLPPGYVDKRTYGRICDAYVHRKGYLLLHVKASHYKAEWNKTIGSWAVYLGRELIDEDHYYGHQRPKPPTTWANRVVKQHREKTRENYIAANVGCRVRMHKRVNQTGDPPLGGQ